MAREGRLTPMMAQYRKIKSGLPPDTLLLFRLGDFYEMFYEDAVEGARILNVALTRRGQAPMCGIPYHAAASYIGRLLRAGRRVAVCDQVEEARPGKLVRREVTQILSPGAHFDERMLAGDRNNFLACVCRAGKSYGLALVDLTTGELRVTETEKAEDLLEELQRARPSEVVCPSEQQELIELLRPEFRILNPYEDWAFAPETAGPALMERFGVRTLDGYGLRGRPAAVGAAGAALHYLAHQLRRDVSHITEARFYRASDCLATDVQTLRNLEVLEPLRRDAPRNASLFGVLNRTATPMGARRMRDWLARPLGNAAEIIRRHDAVEALLGRPDMLEELRRVMDRSGDMERTLGRLSAGQGGPRDLAALRLALERLPKIRNALAELNREADSAPEGALFREEREASEPSLLRELEAQLEPCPELADLLARAVVEEPPAALKEGGFIRDGFDERLDELRRASREGKKWIAELQQREIARTGIQSLKIRFNAVFGYYIEITKANLAKAPADYIRKQTVANGERYVTPELKEMEAKILGAEERAARLEQELLKELREEVLRRLPALQRAARALGALDALAAFAETARLYDYCRPVVRDEGALEIRDGRHPVLEQTMAEERFVPNDAELGRETQIAVITGPNMAGKSTYIRQVALLTLMAHAGSFVPARSARIDLVDRLFTRIGASDDLSRGQSTFMVEMSETANILRHATARSLVILDEVGRGTSTFDGLSLAWSIVEHLHNQVGAKTLFATHYHELTELARRLPRVRNYNVAVREWKDQVVFLHKIVEGAADKSYGIHVARLAGVPRPVIERAKEILANLEEAELNLAAGARRGARRPSREALREAPPSPQLDLFADWSS